MLLHLFLQVAEPVTKSKLTHITFAWYLPGATACVPFVSVPAWTLESWSSIQHTGYWIKSLKTHGSTLSTLCVGEKLTFSTLKSFQAAIKTWNLLLQRGDHISNMYQLSSLCGAQMLFGHDVPLCLSQLSKTPAGWDGYPTFIIKGGGAGTALHMLIDLLGQHGL